MAEVKQLRETVEQLQEIINRNSRNSSQPPSQDRPAQKPAKEPSDPPMPARSYIKGSDVQETGEVDVPAVAMTTISR